MLRFSLLTLLAAVLFISIACAALVSASELWAKIVVTGTVVALLIATVGAFYLPSKRRAFAGGFAICGWAYLLLVQGPWFGNVGPRLLTTVALNHLQVALHKDDGSGQTNASRTVLWSVDSGAALLNYDFVGPPGVLMGTFHQIGQALWAVLLAFLGGLIAKCFDGWRRKAIVP